MKVKDIMSASPCFILQSSTIQEAAQRMRDLDCGFLPVGENDRLVGTITDRDIALRAVGEGLGPATSVGAVMTKKVLYCYQDDSTDNIAHNMAENQIRRLVVLDNPKTKHLVGVVALADIVTSSRTRPTISHDLIKRVSQPSHKWTAAKAA